MKIAVQQRHVQGQKHSLPINHTSMPYNFDAVVGHKHYYLSSMFDNQAGNNTGIEGVHDYCRLFRTLRTPYYRVIGSDTTKDSLADAPSSLWVCIMGHQTANKKQPNSGKRYFFVTTIIQDIH